MGVVERSEAGREKRAEVVERRRRVKVRARRGSERERENQTESAYLRRRSGSGVRSLGSNLDARWN